MDTGSGNAGPEVRLRAFLMQASSDPGWHLHYLDVLQGKAGFVRLERDEYRQSTFLDDRIRLRDPRGTERRLVALDSLLEHWPGERESDPAHFIFHPGHSGSTLASRLLDELGGVLVLREPTPLVGLSSQWREQGDPLANLSPAEYQRLERFVLAALGRTFTEGERAVVKATSECCNLAGRVLGNDRRTRVVWFHTDLETFLANMLRNRVRREETRAFSQSRLLDLHRLLGGPDPKLFELDIAQRTAMNWLSSMSHAVPHLQDERMAMESFDRFLEDPRSGLERIARHLGLEPDAADLERAVSGKVLGSYSKDPGSDYDAARRRLELDRSRREHADAVRKGLDFAEDMAGRHQGLAPLRAYLTD